MPGFDRTGPMGQGPLTGRGLGPCGRGLAFRRGFSAGYGYRPRYGPAYIPTSAPIQYPTTKEQEITELRNEKELIERDIEAMKSELKNIEDRLKELERK